MSSSEPSCVGSIRSKHTTDSEPETDTDTASMISTTSNPTGDPRSLSAHHADAIAAAIELTSTVANLELLEQAKSQVLANERVSPFKRDFANMSDAEKYLEGVSDVRCVQENVENVTGVINAIDRLLGELYELGDRYEAIEKGGVKGEVEEGMMERQEKGDDEAGMGKKNRKRKGKKKKGGKKVRAEEARKSKMV